jgi:hypothetical protein
MAHQMNRENTIGGIIRSGAIGLATVPLNPYAAVLLATTGELFNALTNKDVDAGGTVSINMTETVMDTPTGTTSIYNYSYSYQSEDQSECWGYSCSWTQENPSSSQPFCYTGYTYSSWDSDNSDGGDESE